MSRMFRSRTEIAIRMVCLTFVAICCLGVVPASSQEPSDREKARMRRLYESIPWETGPTTGRLGTLAEIQVPPGYQFTAKRGAATWMELNQNPPDPSLEGVLMPVDATGGWFLVFSYEDIGHVSDGEKENLDANAIMNVLRAGTEAANKDRRHRGWGELEIVGWISSPAYDKRVNRLVWATRCRCDGGEVANYDTRVLGRQGVMAVKLVANPDQINVLTPTVNDLLSAFAFTSSNKYSEWRAGDKVAAYGLTGLITGGATVVAAKSGLLAKLAALLVKGGKAIFIGIAAILAAIWKMLSGKRKKEETS